MENKNDEFKEIMKEYRTKKRIKKNKWSSHETKKLFSLIEEFGCKWTIIAQKLHPRTSKQCMQKYYNMILVEKKGRWNEREDQTVLNWVNNNGPTKWSECAKLINGRCGKQCRERWLNFLNPNVKRGKWSVEEQINFITHLFNIGLSWVYISQNIKSRSENLVKNFFYCSIRMLRLSPFYKILKQIYFRFGHNSESKFNIIFFLVLIFF